MTTPLPLLDLAADGPPVALGHLDDLWFQVTGTLCNLECRHCFISCSPHNHQFGFLDLATVRRVLDESVAPGVKEYYFTGGEPFLHRDLVEMLELTLHYGPVTVLTNGTVLQNGWLQRLRRAEDAALYSLEVRVSLDGFSAADNDPVRGAGTFERVLAGVRQLVEHGFLPIITVTRTHDDQDDAALFAGFVELLRARGYDRPRLKLLPTLRIGAEAQRQRGYRAGERVTATLLENYDTSRLLCQHSRIVTDRGVHVCPILIEAADARLGATLYRVSGTISTAAPGVLHLLPVWRVVRQSFGGQTRCVSGSLFSAASTTTTWRQQRQLGGRARRRGVDAIYCLGDLGAFGPFPDRVFPLLHEQRQVQCLQGNYDHSIGNGLADCQCGYTDPRDNYFAQISYNYTLNDTRAAATVTG